MTSIQRLMILVVVAFLPYISTFNDPFHFDDYTLFQMDKVVNPTHAGNWLTSRVVGYATFALNYAISGKAVFGYHLVNWLIHLGSGLLVWQVLLLLLSRGRLKQKQAAEISFFAAAIFLAHPIQTQAITYIIQRLASLATFWYLLAVWLWLKQKWWGFGVAAILAVFTKETGVTLPFTIWWIESLRQGKKIDKRLGLGIMALALLISFFVWRAIPVPYVFKPKISSTNETVTSSAYLLTETRVLVTYFRLLILPIGQNLDYYYPLSTTLLDWRVIISLLILIGLGYLLWFIRKKAPLVVLGMGWLGITLMVESSVMPIADVIFEHRLYLPMVGFALAVAAGWYQIFAKRISDARILGGILILLLMWLTYRRNLVWGSEYLLWQDVVGKSPQIGRDHNLFGVQLYLKKDYPGALSQFQVATKLNPDIDGAYANAGHALMAMRRYAEAINWYKQALQVNPNIAVDIPKYLTEAYEKIGDASAAAQWKSKSVIK